MESVMRGTRAGNARELPFDEINDARKLMAETNVCRTAADCKAQARSEGLHIQLLDGPRISKGCFIKKNVAYWNEGGTTEEISTPNMPGALKRMYCVDDGGYVSKLAISSIVISSVVFLAFVGFLVAKVKRNLSKEDDEDSTDLDTINSTPSVISAHLEGVLEELPVD